MVTLSMVTLSIATLIIMTISTVTLSTVTLSMVALKVMSTVLIPECRNQVDYAECHSAKSHGSGQTALKI
jgi:hypothetical protein